MRPIVSVIITTYNQARYISQTIQSALEQDFHDREIIVVDDGSTDDTPRLVDAFGQQVVHIRQRNQGVAGSRNAGILQARGEFLAFLDGDDLWAPCKLSRQVRAAREQPSSGLIVADGVQFDREDTILRPSILAPSIRALLGSAESVTLRCYEQLLEQNVILTSSQVLIPRTILDQVGVSDVQIGHASDWDLYLRIAARYEVTFLRDLLTRWRYLPTSVSGPEHLREMRWAADEIGVLRKHLRSAAPESRPLIQGLIKTRTADRAYTIYRYGKETDRAFARAQLLRLLRRHPTSVTVLALLAALHLPWPLNRRLRSLTSRLLNLSRWSMFPRRGSNGEGKEGGWGTPEAHRTREPQTRVLFVTKTPVYGGAEKHLLDLLARVDQTRIEAVVLCVRRDVFSEPMRSREGLRVVVKTMPEPRGLFGYWAIFARFRPHVIVFVNGELGLFPWQAYAAGRLGRRRRVVGIEHLIGDHAPERREGRGLLEWVRRIVGWRARYMIRIAIAGAVSGKTICVSNAVRDRLVREYGYPTARTIAIANGVDVEHYRRGGSQTADMRTTLGIPQYGSVILTVASLVAQKRIDLLLEALARLAADGMRCTCIVAGDGPLRARLIQQASDMGLSSAVFFVGFVPDIRPYLAACDLFVLASDKEGMPLALLEAMAYEVPCIATDVGGNREVITPGENGVLVEPGSPEALAGAIRYGLTNEDAMRTMARNGVHRVRRDFRVEETMKRLEAALLR